ncbi:MAG TPA: RsmB/NOP family class I SAM-dependent RNA methyltransferase [Candidatus Saccharimonadales bacterium]|nr:RsmB/NOP family class I SAM-dependent RNA methyltransferase [Candidatus Saccharimonadales bacterium]
MSKKPADKLAAKRAAWLERTMRALGTDETETLKLLDQTRQQSIRLNPLVAAPEDTLEWLNKLGWQGRPFVWAPNCYSAEAGLEAVRDSELVESGAVYIQNAASWLPVLMLEPQPGEAILDVCAAPGGKASHIAAITGNEAALAVNDNSRARLAKLQSNLSRLGVAAEYNLFDARQLARKFEGRQFDKILLDAPCSGEGMMRYSNDKDFATWSVAHIKRLESLQKQIILQAWQLLKPGGTLVYSTCTMAPEENEAIVDYLLRKAPDAAIEPITFAVQSRVPAVTSWNGRPYKSNLQGCLRLRPHPLLEAFFVCSLKKLAGKKETML